MKALAIALCSLHFIAVLMTSCLPLCAGANGRATYEWRAEDCCCAGEPEARADEPGPAVSVAPDCGGCADGLAPLPGGMQVDVEAVMPSPAESGTVDLVEWCVTGESVTCGTAAAVLRVSLPLRC